MRFIAFYEDRDPVIGDPRDMPDGFFLCTRVADAIDSIRDAGDLLDLVRELRDHHGPAWSDCTHAPYVVPDGTIVCRDTACLWARVAKYTIPHYEDAQPGEEYQRPTTSQDVEAPHGA